MGGQLIEPGVLGRTAGQQLLVSARHSDIDQHSERNRHHLSDSKFSTLEIVRTSQMLLAENCNQ